MTSRTLTVKWFREDLVKALADAGHEVLVLGDEAPNDWGRYFSTLGVRYCSYPVERTGMSPIADWQTLKALVGIFRAERPDIVFTYQMKANVYGCLAARFAHVGKRFASVEGLGSVLSAGGGLKKSIVRQILLLECRLALSGVDGCFFVNSDDKRFFVERGIVAEGRAIFVDGVGVNLERFAAVPLPTGRPLFLFVGRLIREKGILEYIEAARMLKASGLDAEFHILGGMDTNPSALSAETLQNYIEDGSVQYDGEVDDVVPHLQACTVFVLPSYYAEGLPKSAMEAMATGRAIIMADNVGCRDLVKDGVNGFLVEPRDCGALAKAMAALAESTSLCEKMGRESRKMAESRFDVRVINRKI